MIVTENITIGGQLFARTYSNEHRYVVRDGAQYEEAIDPAEFGRTYTEGEIIEEPEADAEEIVNILLGGAT